MSSYSPRTPSRAQSVASGRVISSSASTSSHAHFTSGIRLVPYIPPKALDDNRSHRSSVSSQFNNANVVIEGETQLDSEHEEADLEREFEHERQHEPFGPEDLEDDEHHHIDDDEEYSDGSEFEAHSQQQRRRIEFYRQQNFLRPQQLHPNDADMSFAFSDDIDMGMEMDPGMESSEPSFRPISSGWHTSELLADETAATEASMSSQFSTTDVLALSQSAQVSGSSTPRPAYGNATPSTPTTNNRPYTLNAWAVNAAVHSDSEDSSPEPVTDHGDPPSLAAGASSSFGQDLPPLPLPPFAPSSTPSAPRSRKSSICSENLRPSTAGGKKRRNQLMLSSDGKTFSLAPLSPTSVSSSSSYTPAPLIAHNPFKAATSEAKSRSRSRSNYTRSNSNYSFQSSSNTVSPRPLPSTPVAPLITNPKTIKSAATVAAIPIPKTNAATPSIRTTSASANSVLSSSLDSSASSTIRPVFDTSHLGSSALSSPPTSRSASSLRRYSDDASFADTRATTPSDSLLLSPTYSFTTRGKAAVAAPEAAETEQSFSTSPLPSTASTWRRMIGGFRQVPLNTQEIKTITTVATTQPPTTVTQFSFDTAAVDLESPVSGSESPLHKDTLIVAKRNSAASSYKQTQLELHHSSSHARQTSGYPDLHEKSSFQSESTLSETSNYKVYTRSSSPPVPEDDTLSLVPSLDSNTNIQILGQSSPPASVTDHENSLHDDDLDVTVTYSDDDDNFVVHNVSELLPSSSPPQSLPSSPIESQQTQFSRDTLDTPARTVQPEFSQESLRVQPLRPSVNITPASRPLSVCSEVINDQDNEHVRHAPSPDSLHSAYSLETVESLLATPAALYIRRASVLELSDGHGPGSPSTSYQSLLLPSSSMSQSQDQWSNYAGASSSAGPSELGVSPIQAHPHKWSDQLSTVMSETEPSSSAPHSPISRSGSMGSFVNSHVGRRSGGGYASSANSRRMPSISSSVAVNLESGGSSTYWSHSRSNSASVERPTPTYQRSPGPNIINHVDEYGDGLGELNALQSRPSRTRLGSMFSGVSSDRNLHSSSSARSHIMNATSLPTWARLYYGSGERRPLPPPSEYSEIDSRPTSRLSRVASSEFFPFGRRKQRSNTQGTGPRVQTSISEDGAVGLTQTHSAPARRFSIRAQLRKQTSSIWSPHLRQDRRTILNRYSSMWDPPSVAWYSGSSFMSSRNIQVVSFILGFVFPFAWMIAAFLSLPSVPPHVKMMEEGRGSTGDVAHMDDDIVSSQLHTDEAYHLRMLEGARWWRRLNRYMSVVGLMVVGAVVALIVIGVQ